MHRIFKFSALLLIISLFGCSSIKKVNTKIRVQEFANNYCAPTVPYNLNDADWTDLKGDSFHTLNLSEHDLLVCKILGITNYITYLTQHKTDLQSNNYSKQSSYKHLIMGRLQLAQSQLQAVAAELDCEGERAEMAGIYLDQINSKRNTQLTVASVLVGALTTVATAVISKNSIQTTVGVSGGLISAGLGALTINPKGKQIQFNHDRNLLTSIWTNQAKNTDYPSFIWLMLHEKKFSNTGLVTLAQSIKNRWLQFQFDGKIDPSQAQLLFGKGGLYRSEDLHDRSSMLNQLQSTIRSFNQDLTSIIAYTTNL